MTLNLDNLSVRMVDGKVQLEPGDFDVLVAELRAEREVIDELGPLLVSLRVMHGQGIDTNHNQLPCGWCRLIATFGKVTNGEAP